MAELKLVAIEALHDHPDNPRVLIRDDVVDGITANLNGEWPQKHALHVRPVEDGYQIVSGHHRKRAAEKAGIEDVWCWVEDMSDEDAFMALATANNQGELSPLEIGLHALKAVPNCKGKSGGGQAEYATQIGRSASSLTHYINAARVWLTLDEFTRVNSSQDHHRHLTAIHSAPTETWSALAEWMLNKQMSVADVTKLVKRVKDNVAVIKKELSDYFPIDTVVDTTISESEFGVGRLNDVQDLIGQILKALKDDGRDIGKAEVGKYKKWLKDNIGGDAWSRRKVQNKLAELQTLIAKKKNEDAEKWLHSDWREAIGEIKEASIKLLLIDPPYGQDWQSNHRKEKKKKIAADDSIGSACDELRDATQAAMEKLRPDAHILCFCRHDSVGPFQATLRMCGLTVKSVVVWVKNNHGTGDLYGTFLPKHEFIIHAVKGKPQMAQGKPDVIECAKVSSDNHPTEKPVELLQFLIEATTVSGELVADFFAGVGSTCVAAKECERDWFGCELEEDYFNIGKERLGVA